MISFAEPADIKDLARGAHCFQGHLVSEPVARALQREYKNIDELL